MHPDMNLRLAQLRIDDMTRRAAGRRTTVRHQWWRRRDTSAATRATTAAPAPLVRLPPPRPLSPGDAVGGGDRRAA
jgi:hypothetical protein